MQIIDIERFFLNTLLKISFLGVLVIFLTDVFFFPEDKLSISIDVVILLACGLAFTFRKRYPTAGLLTVLFTVLLAMTYQCLKVPYNTTTSMSILLVIGFVTSVMLKGTVMWTMHAIVFTTINVLFAIQFITPSLRFTQKMNDLVTVSITYSILYFLLAYAAGVLKLSYDKMHKHLSVTNDELKQKADEIVTQNAELLKMHNHLNSLNTHLEKIVDERTAKIQQQNEILYKYSFTNAHHLRGPVARLLGLANIYGLTPKPDPDFIIKSMADQAQEIDVVVKQINVDLDTNSQFQPKGMTNVNS